jgi:hypothetical protein
VGHVPCFGELAAEALPEMLDILATPTSAEGVGDFEHRWVLDYLELLGPKAAPAVPVLKRFVERDNDPHNVERAEELLDQLEER